MNTVYDSTCLYLPLFLSSVSYSFLSTGLPWLGLFLGIWLFLLLYRMGFFSDFCFCCFIVGVQECLWFLSIDIVSGCYAKFISQVKQFFGGLYRIFYIHLHIICKQWQFYFFLLNLGAFYFFFVVVFVVSLWLGPPILCWIEVVEVDTLVLFLILVGKSF